MASISLSGDQQPIYGSVGSSPIDMGLGSATKQPSLNLTPGYQQPAPGPNSEVPRPGVNPSVVYTDRSGNGYDAPALSAAWQNGTFANDPTASRIPDLLASYGLGGAQPAAAAAGNSGGSASTFSDPASQQWESILNQRISQLQTPYQNPGFDTAVNQLNQYLTRLNGPAYTPDQMSLIQSQAIQPIEQARTQAKQQITQRLASHGIGPGSGILEKALEDADQQFNAARDHASAQFATQAVGQGNQNAQLAAQIAPMIASLYQGQFNAQDQRANQAASLAGVIPMNAWERLLGANGTIAQTNPASLFGPLNAFQTQGYGQNADFASGLMQLLPLLFGLQQ